MEEYKIVLGLFGFLLSFEVVLTADTPLQLKLSKEECFHCSGFDGGMCINFGPNIKASYNISFNCDAQLTQLSPEMQAVYGDDLKKSATAELQCVYYVKRYSGAREEHYQGCMSRGEAEDLCLKIMLNGSGHKYQLKKCVICGIERCGGVKKFASQSYFVSFAATAVILYSNCFHL